MEKSGYVNGVLVNNLDSVKEAKTLDLLRKPVKFPVSFSPAAICLMNHHIHNWLNVDATTFVLANALVYVNGLEIDGKTAYYHYTQYIVRHLKLELRTYSLVNCW